MDLKDLKEMKLNEMVSLNTNYHRVTVQRVPGGWIYTTVVDLENRRKGSGMTATSVFVPVAEK